MLSDLLDPSLVQLEANDPVKYLFPLAAKDSGAHLSALQSLVELLADPDFFDQLDSANTPQDVMDLVHAKEGK